MQNLTLHIYGWFAYLSAVATILTFITGILFFTIGKPFGKINDISSVFQVLFMIPLAMILARTLPARYLTLGLIAATIGVSGMILSAIGQSLLVFGRIVITSYSIHYTKLYEKKRIPVIKVRMVATELRYANHP